MANFWDDFNAQAQERAALGHSMNWADFERQLQLQQLAQHQSQPQPQAKKNKKGFWTDQISTGGGLGGALGGAALGAAAGSVVPVVGTAVGGLLGALIGGGLGSAGGEAVENRITGDELSKNVLKEGLIGGVTSLPVGAGLKLAGAGVKAATGIGKKTAGELVQEAGVKTIGKGSINRMSNAGVLDQRALDAMTRLQGGASQGASKFGTTGKLKSMGDQALLSQYGTISKPVARQTNPTETISALADAGLIKPTDVDRVASSITGSGGLVNQAVARAVGGAGDVDTSTMRRVFQDALDNHGVVEKDRKSLTTLFDAQMNRLAGGAQGSLNPKVNPTEALATMRAFEERIANLSGKGGNYSMPTPERIDQANVLKLVRDELQDQLYNGAGANANISGVLTPKLREDLLALMPKNAKWQQYVDKNIMGAGDIAQLRSAQAPFVRAGKIVEEGDINAMTFGGRAGNAFATGGIKDMLGTAATNLVKDPLARTAGQGLRVAGGAASAKAPGQIGQSLLGATVRQGAGRALTADAPTEEPATLEQALSAATGTDPLQASMGVGSMAGAEQMAQEPTNPFGFTRDEVAQGIVRAMAANDKTALAQLQDLYSMIDDFEASQQEGSSFNATTQKALAQSANADSTLNQLEQLLNNAGGAGGPVGGAFSSFLGNVGLNGDAKTYNDLASGSVTQIAKALGETGAMSDSDRIAYQALLPKITDTPEVAANKFRALRARMAAAHQNTMLYGAGDGGLESALMSAGY